MGERGRCRHRLPWNEKWRCEKRGLLGYCVEHWLERGSWVWETRRLHLRVDLSNVNRPHLIMDPDRPRRWVSLQWGNGNGDPVWMVEWHPRGN